MPRIARKDMHTSFLHVMVQGVNKEYIFSNTKYIENYLEIITKYSKEHNFTIIAYCIMNNHAHFLVHTEDINDFAKFMQKTNLLYAHMYNKAENRSGVLFRNRYQTEPIYDMKYLINCIKYIHNNPVKAKMVVKCEDYKYSSYRDYITNKGVTKSKIMQELFGANCNYAELFKEEYDKKFMDIDDEYMQKEYIEEGIREFKKEHSKELIDILANRDLLKKLIMFLKRKCGFKYIDIRKYFGISKGIMEALTVKE